MKKLRDIMRQGFLFTIQRGATVAEAVRTMAANNVGIVAVLDGDRLGRGFSQRGGGRKGGAPGLDPAPTPGPGGVAAPALAAAAPQGRSAGVGQKGTAHKPP